MANGFDASISNNKLLTKEETLGMFESLGLYDPAGVAYTEAGVGQYIVGTNNMCYTADTWANRSGGVGLLGIGVIHSAGNFIIAPDAVGAVAWDANYSTNGTINGCSTSTTAFDGIANTDAIIAVNSDTTSCAAAAARSYTWSNPMKSGYLGCYAEWNIVLSNYTAIEALMSAAGGTPLMDTSASEQWLRYGQYWASTESASNSSNNTHCTSIDVSTISVVTKSYSDYAARSFTQF